MTMRSFNSKNYNSYYQRSENSVQNLELEDVPSDRSINVRKIYNRETSKKVSMSKKHENLYSNNMYLLEKNEEIDLDAKLMNQTIYKKPVINESNQETDIYEMTGNSIEKFKLKQGVT